MAIDGGGTIILVTRENGELVSHTRAEGRLVACALHGTDAVVWGRNALGDARQYVNILPAIDKTGTQHFKNTSDALDAILQQVDSNETLFQTTLAGPTGDQWYFALRNVLWL